MEPNSHTFSGKESASMLEIVFLLALCALVGLASIVVVIWLALSGALLSVDGLAFAFISLTIGGFFMFNIGWSVYTGELRELIRKPPKVSSGKDTEATPPKA
jgi:hypothetical protein